MILDYADKAEAINASRDYAMAFPIAENRIQCRAMAKWKMFLDARDISVMPHLAMDGIYEPELVEAICDLVSPGMTCVDVGACFGFTSLVMAQASKTGKVFSFEPHSRCFSMLKNNIEINNFCPRVQPYPNAVGDQDAAGKLAIHKRRYAGATMSEKAKASFNSTEFQDVQVSKLDTLMLGRRVEPDFYMISTEGYEPQVWAGMKGLLHAKRKISIVMEFLPRWYADALGFASDMLDTEGFNVRRIGQSGELEPLTTPDQFIGRFKSHLVLTR